MDLGDYQDLSLHKLLGEIDALNSEVEGLVSKKEELLKLYSDRTYHASFIPKYVQVQFDVPKHPWINALDIFGFVDDKFFFEERKRCLNDLELDSLSHKMDIAYSRGFIEDESLSRKWLLSMEKIIQRTVLGKRIDISPGGYGMYEVQQPFVSAIITCFEGHKRLIFPKHLGLEDEVTEVKLTLKV